MSSVSGPPAPEPSAAAREPRPVSEWIARLRAIVGAEVTDGNEITVLRNGDEIFPAMISAIDDAEHTVDIVTFVYWTGDIAVRLAQRLAAAATRGCRVRVLLDAIGARKIDSGLVDEMSEAGCQVEWFRPIVDGTVPDLGSANGRTHRKILVCDGQVAFTGGVGIAEEWTGDARSPDEWRDTHLRVRGPAVAGLAAGFLSNWVDGDHSRLDAPSERLSDVDTAPGSTTCMVVQGSSGPDSTAIERLLLSLVQLACERVRFQTAYFNPDEALVDALGAAVERGVEVQVMVPGEHADKRLVQMNGEGRYEELLDRGVDLRTYERTMLHAKVATIDGVVAAVGSANLNRRSLHHDEECDLVIFDDDTVGVLDRHFDDDLTHTVRLDPKRWAERSTVQKVGEAITSLADRWL